MVFEQITYTFINMNLLTAICLVLGLVCVICEIAQPGFKAMGVMGAILLLSGVVIRLLNLKEGEQFFSILFTMVAVISIIILISFVVMVRFIRYTWINYMPDVSDDTPEEADKRYGKLCGIEGVSLTTITPVGKAELCGEEYTVLTDGFFIERGERIKVVRVEKENIIVRKL